LPVVCADDLQIASRVNLIRRSLERRFIKLVGEHTSPDYFRRTPATSPAIADRYRFYTWADCAEGGLFQCCLFEGIDQRP